MFIIFHLSYHAIPLDLVAGDCVHDYGLTYSLPTRKACRQVELDDGSWVQTIPKLLPVTTGAVSCLHGVPSGHRVCRVPDCQDNPCLNSGNCTETMTGFNCACPQHYEGSTCETYIPPLTTEPTSVINNATSTSTTTDNTRQSELPSGRTTTTGQRPIGQSTVRGTTVQIRAEETTVDPTTKALSTSKQATMHTTIGPINIEETTQAITVQETTEPIAVEETTELTTIPETTEPTTVQETPELTTIQETTELTTIQETNELTTVQETTESTTVQETTEPSTVQETTEPTTLEDTTKLNEPTTFEDTTKPTTFADTTEQTTVQETTDLTTIEATTEQTTFEYTTDQTTAVLTTEGFVYYQFHCNEKTRAEARALCTSLGYALLIPEYPSLVDWAIVTLKELCFVTTFYIWFNCDYNITDNQWICVSDYTGVEHVLDDLYQAHWDTPAWDIPGEANGPGCLSVRHNGTLYSRQCDSALEVGYPICRMSSD